jgi:hypothetical protein
VPPKVGDWQVEFTEAPFFIFVFFHNSSGSRDNRPFVNETKIVFGLSIHRGSINFYKIRGDVDLNNSHFILQK